MKCSNCGEVWFQLPDPDELIAELEEMDSESSEGGVEDNQDEQNADEAPLEDIPDAVKPLPDEEGPAEIIKEQKEGKKQPDNMVIVLLSAVVMMVLLASPLIAMKSAIMDSWPESIAFYDSMGMVDDLPGEGVIFDQMRADIQDNHFILSGQLINLTSNDKKLPLIEVTLKDQDGNAVAHHYIRPPEDILKAEATLPITAKYQVDNIEKLYDANIRFVLGGKKAKTVSKDGGNNQALHADDPADPHAGAKALKSPARGGAPPHQESSQDSRKEHH